MVRDERNLEGKTCIFNTHGMDSQLKIHDGKHCVVKSRMPEDKYDFTDIGTIWKIELENEEQIEAFADEIEEIQNKA